MGPKNVMTTLLQLSECLIKSVGSFPLEGCSLLPPTTFGPWQSPLVTGPGWSSAYTPSPLFESSLTSFNVYRSMSVSESDLMLRWHKASNSGGMVVIWSMMVVSLRSLQQYTNEMMIHKMDGYLYRVLTAWVRMDIVPQHVNILFCLVKWKDIGWALDRVWTSVENSRWFVTCSADRDWPNHNNHGNIIIHSV